MEGRDPVTALAVWKQIGKREPRLQATVPAPTQLNCGGSLTGVPRKQPIEYGNCAVST